MDIPSATLSLNFNAASRSTQEGVGGSVSIGKSISKAFAADIAYAFKATAAANGNVAQLTHSTGVVAQGTGSPVILDGDGKDWQGITLPAGAASLIFLVVVVAAAGNVGTVTVGGADGLESPSAILKADGITLLGQPNAAAVGVASVMALTFSTAGDSAQVWVFAKSA